MSEYPDCPGTPCRVKDVKSGCLCARVAELEFENERLKGALLDIAEGRAGPVPSRYARRIVLAKGREG